MKQVNNSKELNEELLRLQACSRDQEAALTARLKEIEISLQPKNILRSGIRGMLEKDKANHGLLSSLIGAGVEAGLSRLLGSKTVTGAGLLQKLAGSILEGEAGVRLKKLFLRDKKEEAQEEK